MKTYLPFFEGFYESIWSAEYQLEDATNVDERPYDWENDEFDSVAYCNRIGREVVDVYHDWLHEVGITGVNINFVEIESPRFYNYETDKIIVDIDVTPEARKKIMELFWQNEEYIRPTIEENHTTRSGFISFMSNNMDEWTETEIFDIEDKWRQPPYLTCALDYILLAKKFEDFYEMNHKAANEILEQVYIEEFITFAEDLETA